MKIELIYRPAVQAGESEFGDRIQRKVFEVPEAADISVILPQVYAKGLAKWVDDGFGGQIKGNYEYSGKLEDGKKYRICSSNIPKTIKAMDELKELNF